MDSNDLKKVDKRAKKFMKVVRDYLTTKGGGSLPPEWELSIDLLETYYRQYLVACAEVEKLDCWYIATERGKGAKEHPIFLIRDKAAIRMESLMRQMGLTLKSGKQLGTTEVKSEETELDQFLKSQIK
jgi:phage terminase small subunit